MRFLRPDLYITVLDGATPDFKTSAKEYLDRADAIIMHDAGEQLAWKNISLKPTLGKPVFRITPPPYVTPEIVKFVRRRLHADREEGFTTEPTENTEKNNSSP